MGKTSVACGSMEPVAAAPPAAARGVWGAPTWACACGILALVLAAYAPVWLAGFIWDDDSYVTENATLRTLAGLRQIWFQPHATPQYYPLVHTTFWCEYHLWGLHPLGYHLLNVLLHAANALLLWCVLRRLGVPGAWLAAALFAVHPVHVESVAWITERKNVLSTLCYLGSLLAWLHFAPPEESRRPAGRWLFFGLALLLFLGALLSKTVTCSLPATFLLVRWWKQGRLSVRDGLLVAPFTALGLPLALQTVILEKFHVGAQGAEWSWSYAERALIAGRAIWFYASKLAWPGRLTFIYPRWQIGLDSWRQYLFPVAVLGVFVVLYGLRRRLGRGPLVAVLFFVGTLVPALGFFDVFPMRYSFVADHFQYLASIGLLVLAGAAMELLLRDRSWTARSLVGGSMLALLAALSWQQARVYHDDPLTLWNDTLAKNPRCWMAYNNRGKAYLKLGQAERALEDFAHGVELSSAKTGVRCVAGSYASRGNFYRELGQDAQAVDDYNRAIELEPDAADVYSSRGLAHHRLGHWPQAIDDYSRAIDLAPEVPANYTNRGMAYQKAGQVQRALQDYTRALELKSQMPGAVDLAGAYTDRGVAYQLLGQAQQAISDHTRALELQPDFADAYTNRGQAYQQLGQEQQALADFTRAIELKPEFATGYYNRGTAYQQFGQAQKALADFTRAIELKPDFAAAYYNRGNLCQQLGQAQQALRDCTRALELQPDLALAYGSRALVYHQQGRLEEAISDYTHALQLKPDYLGAYTNRAMAYQQSGQSERALQDYGQALTLQPNAPNLYFKRAFLYYKMQLYGPAWSNIRRGQELGGTPDPELLRSLAQASGST